MSNPLVSVIVPTYNQEKFILEALNSIDEQNLDFKVEVLIGDDCSVDETETIIKSFTPSNPNIQYVYKKNPQNLGIIENWKYLLSISKGKYIAVCEGDDYWINKDKLKKQASILDNNPTISICYHRVKEINGETNELIRYSNIQFKQIARVSDLAEDNFIYNVSSVYRNMHWKFPEWINNSLPTIDYPLHILNAMHGDIYILVECMAVYRIHKNSQWASKNELQRNFTLMEKLLLPMCNKYKPEINYILQKQLMRQFCLVIENPYNFNNYLKEIQLIFRLITEVVDDNVILESLAFKIQHLKQLYLNYSNSTSYKLGFKLIHPLKKQKANIK